MGQLAGGRKNAAGHSAKFADHAVRIPILLVRQGCDAPNGIDRGTSVTTGIATKKRGITHPKMI